MATGSLHSVLVVCIGNVCRSPMGAALLASRLPAGSVVESAGVAALVGQPADPLAVELMRERGLDLSAHRARQLTSQLASSFDLILVMNERQQRAAQQIFPAGRGRIHRLGRFGEFDIPDPYRQPRAAFEGALVLIERGVADFARSFWNLK